MAVPDDSGDDIPATGPGITADEAMRRLVEGNERFLAGHARFAGMERDALAVLAREQRPYATILGCSDSRVAPELIFDAVLGELFVVRVAGNVLSAEVAGSLQYAGAHLQTPLLVVLGHGGCGAVKAALERRFLGVQHRSRIHLLLDSIVPALHDIDAARAPAEQLAQAVEANVRWTLRQIRESPEAQARFAEGRMKLVGALYDLESGRVRFLDDASGGSRL